jgi:hypothetical protein
VDISSNGFGNQTLFFPPFLLPTGGWREKMRERRKMKEKKERSGFYRSTVQLFQKVPDWMVAINRDGGSPNINNILVVDDFYYNLRAGHFFFF